MRVKEEIPIGGSVKGLSVVAELPRLKEKCGCLSRMVLVRCPFCGGNFQARWKSVKRGMIKRCETCGDNYVGGNRGGRKGGSAKGGYAKGGYAKTQNAICCEFSIDGGTYNRLHRIWNGILVRVGIWGHVENYHKRVAEIYKGKRVCPEWLQFKGFLSWALHNGYRDNLSIDRIDNDEGYFPDNCRWVDRKTQQRNKTNTLRVNGEALADIYDRERKDQSVSYSNFANRVRNGWSLEKALNEPLKRRNRRG